MRKEARAIRELRAGLNLEGAAKRVFEKVRCSPRALASLNVLRLAHAQVYVGDIERLLKMEDMWAHRKAPHTLNWDELSSAPSTSSSAPSTSDASNGTTAANGKDEARIKDQRKLSIKDSFDLFVDACVHLFVPSR